MCKDERKLLLKHECLDRAWLLTETFSTFILEHPHITENEELYKMADEAHDLLYKLYLKLSD